MITLRPDAGLCNRLRTMASIYKMVLEDGFSYKDVRVIWKANFECKCAYEDLFDSENLNIISDTTLFGKKFERLKGKSPLYLSEDQDRLAEEFKKEPQKDFYLASYAPCRQDYDFSWLKLNKDMQIKVDEVVKKLGNDSIGLHIRRTDHGMAIDNSPLYLFVDAVEKELKENPKLKVYVATDDLPTKLELIDKFPDNIVTNNLNKTSRKSVDGMKDAVVDLYALAAVRKIYGSFWSSYSKVASMIGDNELEVLQVENIRMDEDENN